MRTQVNGRQQTVKEWNKRGEMARKRMDVSEIGRTGTDGAVGNGRYHMENKGTEWNRRQRKPTEGNRDNGRKQKSTEGDGRERNGTEGNGRERRERK